MLTTTAQVLTVIAILGNGIVYGTDVFAALIMRSVYARLDDTTMTVSAGWGHHYADQRMPVVGVGGFLAAVLVVMVALLGHHPAAVITSGVAVAALVVWLMLYTRIAKPINQAQTAAARSGVIPTDARALQNKWDSIVGPRVALQTVALTALCGTLVSL